MTNEVQEQPVAGALEDAAQSAPSFMLIIQDDPNDPGQVQLGGFQKPADKFIETSPSHVIGRYIRDHIGEIVLAASPRQAPPADEVKVIGERERTILLPGTPV